MGKFETAGSVDSFPEPLEQPPVELPVAELPEDIKAEKRARISKSALSSYSQWPNNTAATYPC